MESKKKKIGSEEPRGSTGIKAHTNRMDLRTGGGRAKLGQSESSIDIYTLPNVK